MTTSTTVSDNPEWFLDDPELVIALVHWAMSKGAIITRDWLGLPLASPAVPDPGMELGGMTPSQAAVALRRLGYRHGEITQIMSAAREKGRHLTVRYLISYRGRGEEGSYDILPRHPASTASEYQARWLAEIRDIAADRAVTDAQAGGRIRALLFPPCIHEDDGTVEGCPGCFPPGEAIGSGIPGRPVPPIFVTGEEARRYLTSEAGGNYLSREAENAVSGAMATEGGLYRSLAFHDVAYVIENGVHRGYVITPRQPGRPAGNDQAPELDVPGTPWPDLTREYDVSEILAAVRVVDAHLDAAAPEIYRTNPLANMWRRVTKVCEESGEVWDALSRLTGDNPRKGTDPEGQVRMLGELGDICTAALLAIQSQTKNTDVTWAVFIAALSKALRRVPGARPAPTAITTEGDQ